MIMKRKPVCLVVAVLLVFAFYVNVSLVNKVEKQNETDSDKDEEETADFPSHILDDEVSAQPDGPLITLFTTMKSSPDRDLIHNNTLHNWASLTPWVVPVLFVEDSNTPYTAIAKQLGWEVRPVPKLREGLPVLPAMYEDAIKQGETEFYAYANGDILFDLSLVLTLTHISKKQDANAKGFLMVGRRTNVNMKYLPTEMDDPMAITPLRSKGELFVTNAQDYFITTKDGFPWNDIPEFVIGRAGFDNWLVTKALDWDFMLIDSSPTILAVHQTGEDGNKSGWGSKTACVNRDLVDPFDYHRGRTECAPYFTALDSKNVVIRKRKSRTTICLVSQMPPMTCREIQTELRKRGEIV